MSQTCVPSWFWSIPLSITFFVCGTDSRKHYVYARSGAFIPVRRQRPTARAIAFYRPPNLLDWTVFVPHLPLSAFKPGSRRFTSSELIWPSAEHNPHQSYYHTDGALRKPPPPVAAALSKIGSMHWVLVSSFSSTFLRSNPTAPIEDCGRKRVVLGGLAITSIEGAACILSERGEAKRIEPPCRFSALVGEKHHNTCSVRSSSGPRFRRHAFTMLPKGNKSRFLRAHDLHLQYALQGWCYILHWYRWLHCVQPADRQGHAGWLIWRCPRIFAGQKGWIDGFTEMDYLCDFADCWKADSQVYWHTLEKIA